MLYRNLFQHPVASSFAFVTENDRLRSFVADECHTPALVWIGVAIWGIVNGILDSSIKVVVTQLVPSNARAAALGWLALVRGLGLLVAGGVLGLVYDQSITAVIWLIIAANAFVLAVLWSVLRRLAEPADTSIA